MTANILTRQLAPNPKHNPADPNSRPNVWVFEQANRSLFVGDIVSFTGNGRGRGGHYSVTVKVTKVNRKTFKGVEVPRSYKPGTEWTVDLDNENLAIYIELSWKE